MLKDARQLIRVRSDGLVSFNPGGVIRSFCPLDLFLFPYDVQKCHVEFEAWRYRIEKQHFAKVSSKLEIHFFETEEWRVVGTSSRIKVFNYSTGSFDQVGRRWLDT